MMWRVRPEARIGANCAVLFSELNNLSILKKGQRCEILNIIRGKKSAFNVPRTRPLGSQSIPAKYS